jgi:hypothetical protein
MLRKFDMLPMPATTCTYWRNVAVAVVLLPLLVLFMVACVLAVIGSACLLGLSLALAVIDRFGYKSDLSFVGNIGWAVIGICIAVFVVLPWVQEQIRKRFNSCDYVEFKD